MTPLQKAVAELDDALEMIEPETARYLEPFFQQVKSKAYEPHVVAPWQTITPGYALHMAAKRRRGMSWQAIAKTSRHSWQSIRRAVLKHEGHMP